MAARYFLVFGLLLALFCLLAARNVSPEPFLYDEADYMYAATLGYGANWSDTGSISAARFAVAGLSHEGRMALSRQIRSGRDVLFYRHFHGPLFQYFLIPVSRLRLSERGVRTAMLAIPALSVAVVYFGCLWLGPQSALLAAILFLSSYSVIRSTELAPHQLFALGSLTCLILLMKALATRRRGYWYGAVMASGLAFCTLEVGIVAVLTVAVCGFLERARFRADVRFAAKSGALLIATILLVWPAAILRLSFVKSYAVMVYLATQRAAAWGHTGFVATWRERFFDSPLEWGLIALALFAGLRSRRFYPIGLFIALMLLATLRVFTSTPRYSLVFLPELDLLAGLALIPFFGTLRRPASLAVVPLAVVGLYGLAWFQAARQPHNCNPRSAAVLTYIHQKRLEDKALLVPQPDLPMLHYYFPAMRLRGYYGSEPDAADRAGFVTDASVLKP